VGALSGEALQAGDVREGPDMTCRSSSSLAQRTRRRQGDGVRNRGRHGTLRRVSDVTCIIYEGMRHEILNETGHARVYGDVASWLDAHVDSKGDE